MEDHCAGLEVKGRGMARCVVGVGIWASVVERRDRRGMWSFILVVVCGVG